MRKNIASIIYIGSICILFFSCKSINYNKIAKEYYYLANRYYEQKQYKKAVSMYNKAIYYNDNLERVNFNLAKAYIKTKSYKKALDILNELLQKDKGNTKIIFSLAYIDFLTGKYDEAIKLYNQIIKEKGYDENSLFNIGMVYKNKKDFKKAKEVFLKILDKKPAYERAKRELLSFSKEEKNKEKMAFYLEQLKDTNFTDLKELISIYKELEMYEEYSKNVDAYIIKNPQEYEILIEKAGIQIKKMDDIEGAKDTVSKLKSTIFQKSSKIKTFIEKLKDLKDNDTYKNLQDDIDIIIKYMEQKMKTLKKDEDEEDKLIKDTNSIILDN